MTILAPALPALAGGMHHGGPYGFGEPGDPAKADRTVEVEAADDDGAMRFEMDLDAIEMGETIRFVVTNAGDLAHEFAIGDEAAQRAHAEMMRTMQDMNHADGHHDDTSAIVMLAPGETKEIVWRFSKPVEGDVVFACNIPGHAEAGMIRNVGFK